METPSIEEIASWFAYGDEAQKKIVDELADAHIVYACYETGNYEGDWCVIFVKGGKWYEASGGHCSCNGPEWGFSETTRDRAMADHFGRGWGSHRNAASAIEAFAPSDDVEKKLRQSVLDGVDGAEAVLRDYLLEQGRAS